MSGMMSLQAIISLNEEWSGDRLEIPPSGSMNRGHIALSLKLSDLPLQSLDSCVQTETELRRVVQCRRGATRGHVEEAYLCSATVSALRALEVGKESPRRFPKNQR